MKKINLRQGISSILLAGIVLVTGSSLTGCKYEKPEYPNKNSTFINKDENDTENTNNTIEVFQPGEHIISKSITDKITEKDNDNPYNEITQVEYHDGYKCIGLGVSVYAPYRGSKTKFSEASIAYINEYAVECKSSGKDINGNDIYTDFGNPIGYEKVEKEENGTQKEFEIGTHILIIPVKSPKESDIQYTFHEGYELVDIALTSEKYEGNEALAMYVNTEKVKCKKTGENKETGENEFHEFGKPVEKNKTLIK